MNCQPWHFTVVQNKELLNKINTFTKQAILKSDNEGMKERAKGEDFCIFYNSPTLIIISGDTKAVTPQYDCTLALGNMFNAAASLKIGSCWIHAIINVLNLEFAKDLVKELELPEGHTIYCAGSFGYSAVEAKAAPRKDGIVKIIK